ncbi:MAG: cation-translocating P-type ATPase, partial [Gammaproteobacteria bacterium]|nr:cation-translocating P-type ATPase [Gammaproteobacteria bacterium]
MTDGSALPTPTLRLKVSGMDCGSCALTIESALARLDGVRRAQVDFTTETLEVEGRTTREAIAAAVARLGYRIAEGPSAAAAPPAGPSGPGTLRRLWGQDALRTAVGAAAIAAVIALLDTLAPGALPAWLVPAVLAAAVVVAAAPIAVKGLRALAFGRRVTIDLLMTIAAVGALAIGDYWEALAVVALFTFGEALESLSTERARASLRGLLALQPDNATVLRQHAVDHHDNDHGHGHDHGEAQDRPAAPAHDHDHAHDHVPGPADLQHQACGGGAMHVHAEVIPAGQVQPGDRVLVRPGERVPVDGRIAEGESMLNESAVTGESVPVRRIAGDEIMAGTVNGEGALEILASRVASDSTIARIARLVEQAQAQRSPQERFVDRFARLYTPTVVALAVLVVAIPVLLFGQPLLDSPDGSRGWLYRGLALLIVACPCALVISIPVTVVSA